MSNAVLSIVVWVWIGLAVVTFFLLFFIDAAPYGRHQRDGVGPTMPSRLGWIVMETPSLLIMAFLFATGAHQSDPAAWIFLSMWEIHYVHRSFIYPFRCQTSGKTMPVMIALQSIVFNSVNAFINGFYLFHVAPTYGSAWFNSPWFIAGILLFVIGMAINLHSDTILLGLRKEADRGYQIPQGGAFRWISSPNYAGEILEWVGFAVATCSLTGASFAIWTTANLVPRALVHHQWYHATFSEYPPERKALIPYLV